MPEPTLNLRQLGRATLARQMLLERAPIAPRDAVPRLLALQAQLARPPFIALWSRLADFRREELVALVERRELVRATMMRATLHLVTAADFVTLRGAFAPVLERAMHGALRERAAALDVPRLVAAARAFFDEEPRTFDELRDHLLGRFPGADERAMGYAVRTHLPLVQVPAAGAPFAWPADADFAVAETWLGRPIDGEARTKPLVLRYLAAFGPATPGDAQSFTGLGGLREVFEALRPQLHTFRDERRRELFDLPGAPRPDEDTPAPPRLLPDFDSLVLAHDDRARLIADEHRPAIATKNLRVPPTFLVDGRIAGTWKLERKKATATLTLVPFAALPKAARAELTAEAEALARFVEPDSRTADVRVAPR